jgi:hypothetical protein
MVSIYFQLPFSILMGKDLLSMVSEIAQFYMNFLSNSTSGIFGDPKSSIESIRIECKK